jgi:ribosome maturation protein Sdo1
VAHDLDTLIRFLLNRSNEPLWEKKRKRKKEKKKKAIIVLIHFWDIRERQIAQLAMI